jgi:hypothetical protein
MDPKEECMYSHAYHNHMKTQATACEGISKLTFYRGVLVHNCHLIKIIGLGGVPTSSVSNKPRWSEIGTWLLPRDLGAAL